MEEGDELGVERRHAYKKGIDQGRNRQSRMDKAVSLRQKRKRDVMRDKRRRPGTEELDHILEDFSDKSRAEKFLTDLQCSRGNTLTQHLKTLKMVLGDEDAPIDVFLGLGVMEVLLQHLLSGSPENQFEAAWSISNIASGSHENTQAAMEVAPHLINFLKSGSPVMQEQCAWALGNMVSDSLEFTEILVAQGLLEAIIPVLRSSVLTTVATALWVVVHLTRRDTPAMCDALKQQGIFDLLEGFLNKDSEDIQRECVWLLSYLTSEQGHAEAVIEANVLESVVNMASAEDRDTVIGALRTLGNLCSKPDPEFTNAVLRFQDELFPALAVILRGNSRIHTREALWVISNIAGGTLEQVDALMESGVCPELRRLMYEQAMDIKLEVAYCIANLAADGRYLRDLVTPEETAEFVSMLRSSSTEAIQMSLRFLTFLMESLGQHGVDMVRSCGGVEALYELEESPVDSIRQGASSTVERFFEKDLGEEAAQFEYNVPDGMKRGFL